jgi:hypothetical protein
MVRRRSIGREDKLGWLTALNLEGHAYPWWLNQMLHSLQPAFLGFIYKIFSMSLMLDNYGRQVIDINYLRAWNVLF